MNQRMLTILLCAFLIACGASFVVYRLVGKQLKGKTTKVVVATTNLEIGAVIKPSDVTLGAVVGDPPKGSLLTTDAAIGRGVVSDLYQGEPVLEKRLAARGSGGGLAATIPQGMRACAVKVDEVVGVAGFAVPGMRVDVIISQNNNRGFANTDGIKVKTLLQNIGVLSAGTNFQKDNEGKPVQVQVVNLLVTPEQAELLSLASNEAKIQLVLRNPLDNQVANAPGTELSKLFGDSVAKPAAPAPAVQKVMVAPRAPKAALPPPPPVYTVQVLNGSKQSEQTFKYVGAH